MKWCLCALYVISFGLLVLAQESVNSISSDPSDKETSYSDHTTTTDSTTTTATTTTTTAKPTTTSTAPTTTKKPSPPARKDFYSVTDKSSNVTCIMVKGNFIFTITYSTSTNTTNKTTIQVPKPNDPINPKEDGSCATEDGLQYIEITWGDNLPNSRFTMFFNSTDGKTWHILNTTAAILLDQTLFPNATKQGNVLNSNLIYTLSPEEVSMNQSYACNADLMVTNVSTTMEGITYDLPVKFAMTSVKIQAFNQVPKTKGFGEVIPITCCLFSTNTSKNASTSTISSGITTITTAAATASTTTLPTSTNVPKEEYYSVSEESVTCIMLKGNLDFVVNYDIGANETNQTTIKLPKPNDENNPEVDGGCNTPEGVQYITISWGEELFKYSLTFFFSSSEDDDKWQVLNTSSIIPLDAKNFPNATYQNSILRSEVNFEMDTLSIPFNKSYQCISDLTVTNMTTFMDGEIYAETVHFHMNSFDVEAFNQIPHTIDFGKGTRCKLDYKNDIVPLVVGSVIVAVGLLVALVYILTRRRHKISYQTI